MSSNTIPKLKLTASQEPLMYTKSQILLNQAATLREAASILQFHFNQSTMDTGRIPLALAKKAILALSRDQLAIDRHDAELRKKWEAEHGM